MRLASFPLMINVKSLLMASNRICKIEKDLASYLPNLESLILTNNMIEQLADLKPLLDLSHLTELSLINNPVAELDHYRLYLVHCLPRLRILDFRRVGENVRCCFLLPSLSCLPNITLSLQQMIGTQSSCRAV